jgi:hypothetical protein
MCLLDVDACVRITVHNKPENTQFWSLRNLLFTILTIHAQINTLRKNRNWNGNTISRLPADSAQEGRKEETRTNRTFCKSHKILYIERKRNPKL